MINLIDSILSYKGPLTLKMFGNSILFVALALVSFALLMILIAFMVVACVAVPAFRFVVRGLHIG